MQSREGGRFLVRLCTLPPVLVLCYCFCCILRGSLLIGCLGFLFELSALSTKVGCAGACLCVPCCLLGVLSCLLLRHHRAFIFPVFQ